jgi:hypothetical protein
MGRYSEQHADFIPRLGSEMPARENLIPSKGMLVPRNDKFVPR